MAKVPPIPQIPRPAGVTNAAAAVARVQQGAARRAAEVQRITDVGGGVWRHEFWIPQPTPGEAIQQLSFGVTFVESPHVDTGFEMPPNQMLTPGKFPIVSSGVYTWKHDFRSDWGGQLFVGATVVLVSVGALNLSVVHHLSFQGRAMTNIT